MRHDSIILRMQRLPKGWHYVTIGNTLPYEDGAETRGISIKARSATEAAEIAERQLDDGERIISIEAEED